MHGQVSAPKTFNFPGKKYSEPVLDLSNYSTNFTVTIYIPCLMTVSHKQIAALLSPIITSCQTVPHNNVKILHSARGCFAWEVAIAADL